MRRLLLRHLPLAAAAVAVLTLAVAAGLYAWMNSSNFENMVRRRLIAAIEESTGGRVEVAAFHWSLPRFEVEADGLVLHGLEDAGEQPLATVARAQLRLSLLNLFSPKILLRSLDLERPSFHFIVYPDGSTNQPTPRIQRRQNRSALDQLFDLKAGRLSLREGTLRYENRASSFDFQNRYLPLNLAADDVSLRVSYMPAHRGSAETYRIEMGATDMNLARQLPHINFVPVHGYVQAVLDLQRNAANLRWMRLTARGRDRMTHWVDLSGQVTEFAHPRWQAHASGELDLRIVEPVTGYPNTPEGLVRLDLTAYGFGGSYKLEGPVHADNASYIGNGVTAIGIELNARAHVDPKRLLFDSVVVRLRQGGEMSGVVDLSPWREPSLPPAPPVHTANRNTAPPHPPLPDIPMNGRVSAEFKNLSIDTLLDMVGRGPFERLGFDTTVNGPALATWSNGDTNSVKVDARLALRPSVRGVAGEIPAFGLVDATYMQRNGQVDLRQLEFHTPSSQLEAHGEMGAYPLASPSVLAVDFRSHNLGEFDRVLRDLGVKRNGRQGVAALPVALAGEAEIHGSWSGSLAAPRLGGTLKASNFSLEMLALSGDAKAATPSHFVHLDAIDLAGSYAPTRIVVDHALMERGNAHLTASGTLDATAGRVPVFDEKSQLHLRLETAQLKMEDVQPFFRAPLPVSGVLSARIDADGPVRAPNGSGWAELDAGAAYGEPITRLRVEGSAAGQILHLRSIALVTPAGNATGTASYDLRAKRFEIDARGAGIDVARIGRVRAQQWPVEGRMAFTLHGAGTAHDPALDLAATLTGLTLSGQRMGSAHTTAHIEHRAVAYDMTSSIESAEMHAHGRTGFDGGYPTEARMEFSRFNIDALLKLGHLQALNGDSSLAGTVTISGPLAKIDQLRGEARLKELSVTVAGLHLKSDNGLHALLGGGFIHLDPVHITGENTDLRAQGTLALTGARQMDVAASGTVNLKLAEMVAPNLTASGLASFQLTARGPVARPSLDGRIELANGALAMENVPNGINQLHGTLLFSQNRLEVKTLTATSGGGQMNVGGVLTFQNGLYANLTATGKGIRIRYPQGISSQTDMSLRLQGQHSNLLLSGDVMITRFTVSQDFDLAALAAQTSVAHAPPAPDAATRHVRLDVHIASSPQLNFQNAFAKLAGNVDLRLRGTAATPSLLGKIAITEGSARIAGTSYDLQRGDISFNNPVRIEPSIDLNATARVEDYDITLGLHGTSTKMNVSYRSDPPLPEADVVALLALGRTENQQRLYTQQQQQQHANLTTDALLGGALNATVSSRVQKLFGAASVKVDPNYMGQLGNVTSRVIVQEQLGRNLTLTYATNVNTTSQQLLQAEVAINRHISLMVARDESGVFSMVIKVTRRYR
jgi:translocation and assembly module TamB